uniref:Uncharacterized protein n=1 Tax=Rhizophora mucronata TaxID=61149 RepID=A0A2P2IXT7_RHIMU
MLFSFCEHLLDTPLQSIHLIENKMGELHVKSFFFCSFIVK